MSNILIIKHGSLGDLIQSNGAIQDIKNSFQNSKVFLLTSTPYLNLMARCPYINGVLMDKRLPRWNIFYLFKLKNLLKRYKFTHVFDLQNSSRTRFYRKFIIPNAIWSSTETTLEKNQKKKNFDQIPVLERIQIQLNKSGIKTENTQNINLSWAFINISRLIKQYANNEYVLVFPFCSKKHIKKKWPYFKSLTNKIKEHYKNKYSVITAPGPNEIEDAKNLNIKVILDKNRSVDLNTLISLINNAKFVISNDTGPAHIASHLQKNGLVLFGNHTSAEKVSIGNKNFRILSAPELKNLSMEKVFKEVINFLD
tara:strand:+ start:1349 stop:2281 length:933 start_codon:yes stop_codon:yes gene_type:complete